MYLNELIIINYRSCNFLHIHISKDDPNVFIGINDCGKSTILKAIENLLATKAIFSFIKDDKKKNDLSNTKIPQEIFHEKFRSLNLPFLEYSESECMILGKFVIENDDITEEVNGKLSAHLLWVLENEASNIIWYGRIFNTTNQSIKDIVLTPDVEENNAILKLYQETDKKVREKKRALNISDEEVENENNKGRFKKVELSRAIYKKYSLSNFWVEYEIKTDRFIFPECRYLDWNVSMEQLTQFATDTINNKIQDQLLFAKKFATRQAEKAQLIVNQELSSFTEQFAIDLPNIKAFKANINLDVQSKLTDIFINKSNTDGNIHLEQQGEGVKRQIWFALIKWSALNSINSETTSKKFIWCFDEPETHLYPKAQREFFEIIKKVTKGNVQSLISTHSTVFIDRADFSTICKVELVNSYTAYSKCLTVTDIFQSLQIKNSDFLFFDKFLVVEGITEKHLIPHLFKIVYNKNLESCGIQLICLDSKDKRHLNKRILDSLLNDFNKNDDNVIFIFDKDVEFGKNSLTDKELQEIKYFTVGKQDIEDSFGVDFWYDLVACEIPEITISRNEIEDIHNRVPEKIEVQKNQKFDSLLKILVRSKLNDDNLHLLSDRLHEKGKERVDLLQKYIKDVSAIDDNILKAFKALVEDNIKATNNALPPTAAKA